MTKRLATVSVLLVVLVAGAGGAGWWWTHASVLDDRMTGGGFWFDPLPVAEGPFHVGVSMPATDRGTDEIITVRSVDIGFAENSAAADATLVICVPTRNMLGAANGDLSTECPEVRAISEGTRLRVSSGALEHLVLTVTPTRAGRVHVDRVEVTYARDGRHLWQRGVTSGEFDVRITTT